MHDHRLMPWHSYAVCQAWQAIFQAVAMQTWQQTCAVTQTVHRVQVRAAPSMRFAYVEPRLMRTYLRFKSPQQAPSMLAPMTLKEFAMRAQQDSPDSPLFYPHGEFYYMQSPVTRDMRRSGDIDFEQPPFSAVLAPGMGLQQRIGMPCVCGPTEFTL